MNEEIQKRGPGRPRIHTDQRDPTRDPLHGQPRLHRRITATTDRFAIDKSVVPEGYTAEWKRYSTAGKQDDDNAFYQSGLRQNHWEPMMAESYPTLAPHGQTSGHIRNGDQMLMIRPTYLCDEARAEDQARATANIEGQRNAIADAPDGTFSRSHPKIAPTIRKTFGTEET